MRPNQAEPVHEMCFLQPNLAEQALAQGLVRVRVRPNQPELLLAARVEQEPLASRPNLPECSTHWRRRLDSNRLLKPSARVRLVRRQALASQFEERLPVHLEGQGEERHEVRLEDAHVAPVHLAMDLQ
jgi:hypothetical protein